MYIFFCSNVKTTVKIKGLIAKYEEVLIRLRENTDYDEISLRKVTDLVAIF